MICPKCKEGNFRAKTSRYSKRLDKYTRKRVCDKCGFTAKTIEVHTDTYDKENKLMNDIIIAVNRYSEHNNEEAKI